MNIPFPRTKFVTNAKVVRVRWPVVIYRTVPTKRLKILVVLGKAPKELRQDLSIKNASFCLSGAWMGLRKFFTVTSSTVKHTFNI